MMRRATQDLLLGLLFTGLCVPVLRGLMQPSERPVVVAASDSENEPYPGLAMSAEKVASYQIDALQSGSHCPGKHLLG